MEQTILFACDVTPAAVNKFTAILAALAQQGTTKVTICINSSGGNVVEGIFLHNFLMGLPYQIVTHNVGNVDSIANVIFLAGAVRFACPSSTFMFHGVGFNPNPNERLESKNLREKLDTINADHRRIAAIVNQRTGLPVRSCLNLLKQQSTRGADWARTKGFVGQVSPFTYPANGQFLTFYG